MKLLLKIIGASILWYMCFAYVMLEINPLLWNKDQRFDFIFILININVGISLAHYLNSHEK